MVISQLVERMYERRAYDLLNTTDCASLEMKLNFTLLLVLQYLLEIDWRITLRTEFWMNTQIEGKSSLERPTVTFVEV